MISLQTTSTYDNRCERFAEQGCTVYATSRRLETMDGFKHPVEKRAMDVTSDNDVKIVVQSILEEQGKIDIVVNNAGVIAIGSSKPFKPK
jgi:NADP-dependent 3-hydroxy acid dehydrogenase YdfG